MFRLRPSKIRYKVIRMLNLSKKKIFVFIFVSSVCLYFFNKLINSQHWYKMKFVPKFTGFTAFKFLVDSKTRQVCTESGATDDIMCHPRNLSEWNDLFSSPDLPKFKPLFPERTYTLTWEKDYLRYPPLDDSKTLPDLSFSIVTMEKEKEGWVSCDVGQRLTGRLDVKDGYNRQRKDGLDEVRMWMVEETKSQRRAVGQVTDYRNGSYGLEITCLWPGSVSRLYVAIYYPREYIRVVIQQKNAGVTRFSGALFKDNNGTEEITLCLPYPTLPGRDSNSLCNYTNFNGREYYCGLPVDRRLNCSHWNATYPLSVPLPYHVTTEERKLITKITAPMKCRAVSTKPFVRTTKAGELKNVRSCAKVPRNITWDMTSRPQGFWNEHPKWVWTSLMCKTSRFNGQVLLQCLKNAVVYVIGDSNANRIYTSLVERTRAKFTRPGLWPRSAEAKNMKWNITIKFYPHDYPLYLGLKWEPLLQYGSVEQIIERIPSTGRHLVILHYYLHLVPFHLTVMKSRLEAAFKAIARLLKRNADARVAFRGPHVACEGWGTNPSIGGDPLAKQYLGLISTVFKNLENEVLFLDGWEMTLALESIDYHPDNIVPNEMINTFLSFLCSPK